MKISIESTDLLNIADEIQRNCEMLSFTSAEDAEDDVSFYVPVIRSLADDLEALVELKEQESPGKGGAS